MSPKFPEPEAKQPESQRRISRILFALLIFQSILLLLAAVVGITSMDRLPWELIAVIALLTLAIYVVRRGVIQGKRWSRFGTIFLGIFMLPGFPIWTAVGGYLIVDASFNWRT